MKFKVGDKVKIVKYINSEGIEIKNHSSIGRITEIEQTSQYNQSFPYQLKTGTCVCDQEIELTTEKQMPKINWNLAKFIISCKTRKEWKDVVEVAEDNGWTYFKKRSPENIELWSGYEGDSCISMHGIDSGGYCYTGYYDSSDYNGYIHMSAQEFINKYNINDNNQILDEKPNKHGFKTIMSKITTFAKNLILSSDEKLLRKHGLHTECGDPTSEAIDLVITKLVKENEAYLIELAKGIELEEKSK